MLPLKQPGSFFGLAAPSGKVKKIANLFRAGDRRERINILLKIRWNRLLFDHRPTNADTVSFEKFTAQLKISDPVLHDLIRPDGEAESAVRKVRENFSELIRKNGDLPLPEFYNADRSLALIIYGLTRRFKPAFVLETGVGYGLTSSLVLLAMKSNNKGELVSVDLPSLSDPLGSATGLLVSEDLKERWTLHLGTSARWLPTVVPDTNEIGLFVSDSANVFTLQRYEFEAVYPKITKGGAAVFNNVGSKFQAYLRSIEEIDPCSIWQVNKPSCATAVVMKK